MTKFQLHQQTWKNCTACSLCNNRRNVVLFRGQLPCDVLFIGEGPSQSDDVLGSPFVGPAGHQLDEIIKKADQSRFEDFEEWNNTASLRFGFTHLTACIPLNEGRICEPPEESIKACSTRLEEILLICKPKLVVCVGKLPDKWLPKLFGSNQHINDNMIVITHPAAIMRMEGFQQGLAIQQIVVTLRDAFAELQ